MLSAFIRSAHSYPAVALAGQLEHQGCVRSNPLVLGAILLRNPTPTADRDRPDSRRSEPNSRTALIGEQPNPWDRLRSEEHTSELQSPDHLVCRLLLEKKKKELEYSDN